MGIGFLVALFGIFLAIIAVRGTYKYLPPWYSPSSTKSTPTSTNINGAITTLSLLNSKAM